VPNLDQRKETERNACIVPSTFIAAQGQRGKLSKIVLIGPDYGISSPFLTASMIL
jgi:hypothetical protein